MRVRGLLPWGLGGHGKEFGVSVQGEALTNRLGREVRRWDLHFRSGEEGGGQMGGNGGIAGGDCCPGQRRVLGQGDSSPGALPTSPVDGRLTC